MTVMSPKPISAKMPGIIKHGAEPADSSIGWRESFLVDSVALNLF